MPFERKVGTLVCFAKDDLKLKSSAEWNAREIGNKCRRQRDTSYAGYFLGCDSVLWTAIRQLWRRFPIKSPDNSPVSRPLPRRIAMLKSRIDQIKKPSLIVWRHGRGKAGQTDFFP